MFKSAHEALQWAYETSSRPIVHMSGANNMRQVHTSRILNSLLIGLDVQEVHGQAAQIIAMVDRLESRHNSEYLTAKFGRKITQGNIQRLVYQGCDASGLGLSGQNLVYRVMRGYFGTDLTYRAIQKMLGCSNQHALMIKSCLYEVLDVIYDRAMADITRVFEEHGLIQGRVALV